jgi:predicted membrane protein
MSERSGFRCTPQALIGLAVVVVGVLFTLDNLGFLRARDYLRFWPIALMVVGASQIAQARTPARVTSGLLWMLVGSVLLGSRLNLVRWHIWDLWPLGLVVIGGYIIWQAYAGNQERRNDETSAIVSGVAVLGAVQRRISSNGFRGGELTAFMGGCHIDLRDARLADGQAVITVFALMGGIELKVPESWTIVVEVVPFLGGVEDRTRQVPGETTQRLILRGFVSMGGLEIKN